MLVFFFAWSMKESGHKLILQLVCEPSLEGTCSRPLTVYGVQASSALCAPRALVYPTKTRARAFVYPRTRASTVRARLPRRHRAFSARSLSSDWRVPPCFCRFLNGVARPLHKYLQILERKKRNVLYISLIYILHDIKVNTLAFNDLVSLLMSKCYSRYLYL